MPQVHIHEVVSTVRVVDGESLVTGPMLERIVRAVLQALAAEQQDEQRRRRDTRIGTSPDDDEGVRR